MLTSLRHTGKSGTAITLPPVTFTYQMRENRVDATDDILPLSRPRIESVTSETGSITPSRSPSRVRARLEHAQRGRPQHHVLLSRYWNINGAEEASIDWFHKYPCSPSSPPTRPVTTMPWSTSTPAPIPPGTTTTTR